MVVEGKTTPFDLRLPAPVIVQVRLALGLVPTTAWMVSANVDTDPESLIGGSIRELEAAESGLHRFELPRDLLADIQARACFPGWEITLEQNRIQPLDAPIDVLFDEKGGSVSGRLNAPSSPGEAITLTWSKGATRRIRCTTYASEHGEFRFPFAPAGECTLQRRGSSAATRSVDVTAGGEVHVDDL